MARRGDQGMEQLAGLRVVDQRPPVGPRSHHVVPPVGPHRARTIVENKHWLFSRNPIALVQLPHARLAVRRREHPPAARTRRAREGAAYPRSMHRYHRPFVHLCLPLLVRYFVVESAERAVARAEQQAWPDVGAVPEAAGSESRRYAGLGCVAVLPWHRLEPAVEELSVERSAARAVATERNSRATQTRAAGPTIHQPPCHAGARRSKVLRGPDSGALISWPHVQE
mmetsp:Transcript_32191/g.85877  ORF Transcript_32191/g.85877 Transcript_32191/m.85877 type:complete len:226 (-) Transcript_32191:1296-1973(-)